MVPGLQIAGLFLSITVVLTFTVWAETWLALTAVPIVGRHPNAKVSVGRALAVSATKVT